MRNWFQAFAFKFTSCTATERQKKAKLEQEGLSAAAEAAEGEAAEAAARNEAATARVIEACQAETMAGLYWGCTERLYRTVVQNGCTERLYSC
jgi:hypothetical protein